MSLFSIDNPKEFNYLKVCEYDQNADLDDNYKNVYPLTCVKRNTVHIQYSDNSTYAISFDVFNDGSAGFKALHELSRVVAGDQVFVIQKYTKKINGVASASISATQLVNADFQRTKQPRMYKYFSSSSSNAETGNTGRDKTTVYLNLTELLNWYQHGIDMLGFEFSVHGYFPRRPLKNVGKWNGKQLLTQITQTWPGTVIIGWGHIIHIYGYREKRDERGNLQNVRDIDTGLRFDALADTKDIQVSRDTSQMCNAIEVKSATHSVIPPAIQEQINKRKQEAEENGDSDDAGVQADEDLANEFVYQQVPYFSNFLATSARSIQKYGLYASADVLDEGFIHKDAAMSAAREKMVLEPVISITATIDHPGKTEAQPVPGHKYLIGIEQENEVHHVVLRGFDWYPFDPAKGAQLTLNSVDPGIVNNLRSTIIHDLELSPTVTKFNEITADESDGNYDSSSSGSGDDGDVGGDDGDDQEDIDQEDTDDTQDRPSENGPDNSSDGKADDKKDGDTPAQAGAKAYLPIGDRHGRAYISSYGNLTVNKDNHKWIMRVADSKTLKQIQASKGYPSSESNNKWQHLAMVDIHKGSWIGNTGRAENFYRGGDFYLGHLGLFESGMITTQSNTFTFRTDVHDGDYNEDGTLQHVGHLHDDGITYFNDAENAQPGHLARIQAGSYAGLTSEILHYRHLSLLSEKADVTAVDKYKALDRILNTDIADYVYKDDPDCEHEASLIIDDVNKKQKWKTPTEFVTKDGKARKDSVTVAYLVKSVQALNDKIADQDKQIRQLKRHVSVLFHMLSLVRKLFARLNRTKSN